MKANRVPGVVYELNPLGDARVLHNFGINNDFACKGNTPSSGVVLDPAGNVYGTTSIGSACTLFQTPRACCYKLNQSGGETVLYTFTGGINGQHPEGNLVRDAAGNLYGTAANVVYKFDTPGHYSVLHSFTSAAEGSAPQGGITK